MVLNAGQSCVRASVSTAVTSEIAVEAAQQKSMRQNLQLFPEDDTIAVKGNKYTYES